VGQSERRRKDDLLVSQGSRRFRGSRSCRDEDLEFAESHRYVYMYLHPRKFSFSLRTARFPRERRESVPAKKKGNKKRESPSPISAGPTWQAKSGMLFP